MQIHEPVKVIPSFFGGVAATGRRSPADRLPRPWKTQQVGSRLEDDSFPFWGPAYFQGLWLVSFWEGRTFTSKNWIVSDLMKSHSLLKQTPLDIQWRKFIDGQKSVDQQGIFKTKMKRFITSSPYIYINVDIEIWQKLDNPHTTKKVFRLFFFRKIFKQTHRIPTPPSMDSASASVDSAKRFCSKSGRKVEQPILPSARNGTDPWRFV